jgi:hypothetical protein
MNHDELRPALRDAVNRHWRSSMDRSGPTPQLLDELAGIAVRYAAEITVADVFASVTGYRIGDDIYHPDDVTVILRSDRPHAPVAADLDSTADAPGSPESVLCPEPSPSAAQEAGNSTGDTTRAAAVWRENPGDTHMIPPSSHSPGDTHLHVPEHKANPGDTHLHDPGGVAAGIPPTKPPATAPPRARTRTRTRGGTK